MRNRSKYRLFLKKTSLWRKSTAKTLSPKSSYLLINIIIILTIFIENMKIY